MQNDNKTDEALTKNKRRVLLQMLRKYPTYAVAFLRGNLLASFPSEVEKAAHLTLANAEEVPCRPSKF